MVDRTNKRRGIKVREGVGVTAHILQRGDLRFDRIAVDHPTLIVVRSGTKTISLDAREYELQAGDAIALEGRQTIDIRNRPSDPGRGYEAEWIIPDPAVIASRAPQAGAAHVPNLGTSRLSLCCTR